MNFNFRKTVMLAGMCVSLLGYVPQLFAVPVTTVTVQQKKKVTGAVVDESGLPLIGASVIEKGTTNGVTTDFDGKFQINVPIGATIEVSHIGFKSRSVKYNGQASLRIVLEEEAQDLDEVVVVGYGTMKKRDLSGAVAQVKGSDLLKGNPTDLSQGLQGRVAGVVINQSEGAPGSGINIQIRGANSFATSTQPLYIVDGVPFSTGGTPTSATNEGATQTLNPLNFINPRDIESIEILKDASATAIYGSRGANGVVLITTKKGEKGHDKIEVSSSTSISTITKKIDVLDAYTYANYTNESVINNYIYNGIRYQELPYPDQGTWQYTQDNSGAIIPSSGRYKPSAADFLNPRIVSDQYGNTADIRTANWQDLIFRPAFSQEHNINVSGGSDKGWYSYSGGFLNQEGIIKNSGMKRFSFRTNITRKFRDYIEVGMNMNYTDVDTDYARTSISEKGIIRSALIFPPNKALSGTADEFDWLASNPSIYLEASKDNMHSINLFNSSYAEITLFPTLKFRQNIGVSYNLNRRSSYYDRRTQEAKAPVNGRAGQADSWWNSVTSESLLTYYETLNEIHTLNLVGGFTFERSNWGGKAMTATNFPNDITKEYDMSQGLLPGQLESSREAASLVSFLARANYTLKDRYIFTASFRRDGSSKFIERNKYANFLSGAIAWRASEEKIIKDLNFFNDLKFRVSYGETGNQGIGSYRTLPVLSTSNYPFAGSINSGFADVDWRGPVSDNLKWETTAQYNAGVDMAFFDNRLAFTVDYYHKKTRDLLQDVIIPQSTGFTQMLINSGFVTNEGLEISGKFRVLSNTELKWNIDANIAFNRNQIGGLTGDQYAQRLWHGADNIFLQRNGHPIGTLFGYVEDGFYDNEAEVRANPIYTNADAATVKTMIGEIKYRNFDDNPLITENDRVIIGDTNPDFVYGITNNLSWKNFNLSIFIQGSYGNDIFNGNKLGVTMTSIGNVPQFAYDTRWTADNYENAQWPKPLNGHTRNILISNRFVEDGSYLRLRNVTLGYTFEPEFKRISKLNIYLSASNLFTITKYSWYDPDVNMFGGDSSRKGVDMYSYPNSRTFTMGLKIDF